MKVWYGFGTEHSMNLVMIGRFKDAATAETVNGIIDKFQTAVEADEAAGRLRVGEPTDTYSDEMLRLLMDLNVLSVGPEELEQFLYDVNVRRDGDSIVITTDEIAVEAFLKLMLARGARVEVYSAHDYPDTGYGRGK
jgi:hypothetical protein